MTFYTFLNHQFSSCLKSLWSFVSDNILPWLYKGWRRVGGGGGGSWGWGRVGGGGGVFPGVVILIALLAGV
jgi:hypothetical protein